jgi:hypothetical protein
MSNQPVAQLRGVEGDCLPPSGAQLELNARSNLLQHASKWWIGSKTHGSIRIQEGEPSSHSYFV